MKVLIIGSGGREHALAWKCAQDDIVKHVFVCPGNAGTYLEDKVSNVELNLNEFSSIEKFCLEEKVELVIIGPEQPLVDGLTDFLQSKNIKTFGPSKNAAQLEGSKTFSKDFFVKYNIPTAKYKSFDNFESSIEYLNEISFQCTIFRVMVPACCPYESSMVRIRCQLYSLPHINHVEPRGWFLGDSSAEKYDFWGNACGYSLDG